MSAPTPGTEIVPPVDPAVPPAADDFDKDRAMATISKLREFEKTAKAQIKELADLKASKAESERKAAEEAGNYKSLFEQAQTERAALESQLAEQTTLQERYTALTELIEKQAKSRMQALPEEIRAMKPDGDAMALLDWLGKAEIAASKLSAAPRTPGTPPGPRLGSGNGTPPDTAQIVQGKRGTIDYNL